MMPEPDAGLHGQAGREAILDPGQIIIDAHHHLYDRPGVRYLRDDFLGDLAAGHDVRATVFVQARSMYRTSGPRELKPVGETEFACDTALACADAEHGMPKVCAGIVSYADLTLGDSVGKVLEAHRCAGQERFKGIRMPLAWDNDASLLNPAYPTYATLMEDETFRRGFSLLSRFDLSFDAWLFFHQIPRLTALARSFKDTPIVLNHCGGVLGTGQYRDRHSDVRAFWLAALRELAQCENVMVKLGGLGMPLSGLGWHQSGSVPTSTELAEAWRPWMEPCIEIFGTSRCMFESNFPADRVSCDYATGWNAMKRIAHAASCDEKNDLFWHTAARFYRLENIVSS